MRRALTALSLLWLSGCDPTGVRPEGLVSPDYFPKPDAEPTDAFEADAIEEPDAGTIVYPDALPRDANAPDAIVFPDAMPRDTGVFPDANAPDAMMDAGVIMDAAPYDGGVHIDAQPRDLGFPDAVPIDVGFPPDAGTLQDSGITPGQPIVVPQPRTWTWVNFPDTRCDDGTTTGLGVNTSTASSNVLFYFNGGGACWDYDSCFVQNLSTHGPFTSGEFNQLGTLLNGGILDRTASSNPFRTWNFVFIPYCTGDLHGGNNVIMYPSPTGPRTVYHVGRANVLAYLRRLGRTFPAPDAIAVVGGSAGGFGALFNYHLFRRHWINSRGYMVDDSGPPQSGIPNTLRNAWFASWRLDLLTDPICGMICRSDLSNLPPALSMRHPNDRMSFISSLQDDVIRSFTGQTPLAFQNALLSLGTTLNTTQNFKYFYVNGNSHVMITGPQGYNSNNVNLADWLRYQITTSPQWISTSP